MNDDLAPPDDGALDDELVSAVLDGEATPAERARVEGSPEGRRRLAELRAAAVSVGEAVTPLTPAAADALIARAVGAAATPVVVERGTPPVDHDEIGARRDRSASAREWRRRALGTVAAVAAAVVLVIGVAALARATGGRSSDSASSSASDSGASTSETAAGGAADSGSDATRSALVPPDLGPLADAETVLDRYTVLVGADLSVDHQFDFASPEASAGQAAPTAPTLGCPVPPLAPAPGERWTVTADARLPQGPVLVMSNGLAPGANRVLVVDATTCEVVAERTI